MDIPQPSEMESATAAPYANEADDLPAPGVETNDRSKTDSDTWAKLAKDAYQSSVSYMDTSLRKRWDDSLRAFNSQHSTSSKYNNPAYDKRSRVYRPKTRAAIRKNEAATAAALFSSMDVVSIDAKLQSDEAQKASAEVMKALLQYRLMSSDFRVAIPWFMTVMGAMQDGQTMGVVVSRQYWDMELDRPEVKLLPPENVKISPAADWRDPIKSSPFVIEDIPMFVQDVRARMEDGEWTTYSLGQIRTNSRQYDSTRQARNANRQDGMNEPAEPTDYETVWIQRHIHKREGRDWVFYVLPNVGLLTEPVPLEQEVFHGERDYIMGCVIIEAHKTYPGGIADLVNQVQEEINELTNQGLDNTKFVLNKRWFVKRGANVDVASLVRNVPGGATMTNDPEKDVKEVNWPDITPSVFEQQNRLNADFADLAGDFNAAQAQLLASSSPQPATTLNHMAMAPVPLVDYLMRTFIETWVQPVLRQLVKLEQKYETDAVALALAADKAKLAQKFGMDQVTDELLNADLTLQVNVVFGALTPMAKLQRFSMGLMGLANYAKMPVPGVSLGEVAKETFGLLGYQDGGRFLEQDPEMAQMQMAMQQKDQAIAELTQRLADKEGDRQTKLAIAADNNKTSVVNTVLKHNKEDRHKLADVVLADQQMQNQQKESSAA